MLLVVLGGIGFVTLEETYLRFAPGQFKSSGRAIVRRLSIHSRLVLMSSVVLLLGAWPLFAVFEWNQTLAEKSAVDKLSNALFMSVTARTAGFNTIDYAEASDSTNFLTILLMTIGGSPGSTAGGMKTTTFALVFLLAWSRIRGNTTTIFGNRSVPEETIQRAVGISVIAFVVIAMGVFALTATEQFGRVRGDFLGRMFEAVSAFNTVGLSLGVTTELSLAGRWVTIMLMFLGRVGPIMLAAAFVMRRSRSVKFRFAYEDVVVG
jgi:trk system potassium uptake protein TrkH